MPIFQKSVLNSATIDEGLVATRWANLQLYKAKIDAIRDFNEEIYQDGFLHDIFEECLGYTRKVTNPSNYNLDREQKNETNSKKADAGIFVDGKVVGVIELKAQDTKNLDRIEAQAFEYHNENANSRYIIISNFDELRFYIDKKTAYEKFSLFNITYEEFRILHLLISYESISQDIPLKLKEKSATFEAQISKQLYRDFSSFRTHLFENIVHNNASIDKSTLLRLTQKLCDRIVFILFAEDRGILVPNTIRAIREHFTNQAFTDYPLYDIYKFYFEGINNGNDKLYIPKYNGGLFSTDEQLNSLVIDNECLDVEAQKLSDYDFESDISVNILGHIFEQSLTDLEEMEKSFEADASNDKKVSKRKKDGVFYTPEYITRYIVENTLGKLCEQRKLELGITDIEPPKDSRKPTKKEQATKENLAVYRDWLLELKIIDPACGSGAFLNQALEFLIKEHKSLQQNLAIMGDITAVYDIEVGILEHNLYGVDINEDAVEIARLSLWLRTAQKGRMLTNLSDKIVCANSLMIDSFDGKATNPSLQQTAHDTGVVGGMPFELGSFDVVIGNPPYGADVSENDFESNETYLLFYKLGILLLKEYGLMGYITPDSWLTNKNAIFIREYFVANGSIISLYDVYKPFSDAPDVWCNIPIFHKSVYAEKIEIKREFPYNLRIFQFETEWSNFSKLNGDGWFPYINDDLKIIFNKMNLFEKIEEYFDAKRGFSPTPNPINLTKNQTLRQVIGGEDFGRYEYKIKPKYLIDQYSKSKVQIDEIQKNAFVGIQRIRTNSLDFKSRWLICQYFDKGFVPIDSIGYFLQKSDLNLKYLLATICSRLLNLYYKLHYTDKNVKPIYLKKIPIPKISPTEQQPFIELVDEILSAKEKIKKYRKHFESLNAVDKIEITEEIEKLEAIVINNENTIDMMVYKLYGLSSEEIKVVEG